MKIIPKNYNFTSLECYTQYQRVKNMAAISDESFLAALKEIQLCPNGMVVSSSDAQNNAQEIGK